MVARRDGPPATNRGFQVVWSVAVTADGATIVSGSDDKTVRVWDAASGAARRVLRSHQRWVTRVALSADGMTIVSWLELTTCASTRCGCGTRQAESAAK